MVEWLAPRSTRGAVSFPPAGDGIETGSLGGRGGQLGRVRTGR